VKPGLTGIVAVIAVLLAAGGSAQILCPGDSWATRYSSAAKAGADSLDIMSVSILNHAAPHPACGNPELATTTELIGGFSSCSAESPLPHMHYGTDVASTTCSGLYPTCYYARGRHYYGGALTKTTNSGQQCLEEPGGGDDGGGGDRCRAGDNCTPLIVDLAGDGFRFSSALDGVLFQLTGPGDVVHWVGWPVAPDDAWLALDRNGSGTIDDASELFGTATRLQWGGLARDGFQALAELDENSDGRIDANDSQYTALRLGGDANRNGVSEPLELQTLVQAGIVSLSLDYRESRRTDRWGNRFALRSRALTTGSPRRRAVVDVVPVAVPAP
jgi:hypothetical protein